MTYVLDITRSARKEIERLDGVVRRRVVDAIAEIVEDPYRQVVKKLTDGSLRHRVGHYRIVYTVEGEAVTVGKVEQAQFDAIEMSTTKVRENLASVIDQLRVNGDRIVLTHHGRPVAALIDVEDLKLLEEVEDHEDVAEVRRRSRETVERVTIEALRRGQVAHRPTNGRESD